MDAFWQRLVDSANSNQFLSGFFAHVEDLIIDHWTKFVYLVIGAAAVYLWRWWKDRRDYQKAEFNTYVVVTVTTILDGTLRIFTLDSPPIPVLFKNRLIRALVRKAAAGTTEADPVLHFASERDRNFAYISVTNHVSGLFRDALMAKALDQRAHAGEFFLVLTWERAGEMVTQKLRVMVVRRETLLSWPDDQVPALVEPHHITRHHTMLAIKRQVQAAPDAYKPVILGVPA